MTTTEIKNSSTVAFFQIDERGFQGWFAGLDLSQKEFNELPANVNKIKISFK